MYNSSMLGNKDKQKHYHEIEGKIHISAAQELDCPFCSAHIRLADGKTTYQINVAGVDADEVNKVLEVIRKDVKLTNLKKRGIIGKIAGFILGQGIVPTVVRVLSGVLVAYFILKLGF